MAKKQYLEQVEYTNNYLHKYFEGNISNFSKLKILEVGCAEAGFLKVMQEHGHSVCGIELDETRAGLAKEINNDIDVIVGDITDENLINKINEQYDLIVMREVIEHVPDKDKAFENLYKLLKDDGYLFISFPPKYSGFAGHQQVGRSILKFTPYIHLLPDFIVSILVKIFGESPNFVKHINSNYATGISIRRFNSLCRKYNFYFHKKEFYLFRPIYKQRFNLPVIKIFNIPLLREILAFGCECLLRKK
ncbi:MAG: class I SAM-dependent methyltransferase [Ignavibacteria bacterium]|jgi:SAM-dependent methyltransferase